MSKIIGFVVTMDSHVTYDSSRFDSDDPYSRPDTHTEWGFGYAKTDSKYADALLYLNDDEEIPQQLYLVSVIYSTGDSFGNDFCECIEHLMVYKNYADALNCQKLVEEQDAEYRKHNYRYSHGLNKKKEKFVDTLMIPNGDGTEKELSCIPWHGYFESLNNVEIYQFTPRIFN